jgi:hypothetical protein
MSKKVRGNGPVLSKTAASDLSKLGSDLVKSPLSTILSHRLRHLGLEPTNSISRPNASTSRFTSNRNRTSKKPSTTLGNLNQPDHDRLMYILSNFGPDVAGLHTSLKRGFDQEDLKRMKREKVELNLNDPTFANMSIAKMRRICDQLYVTNNESSLSTRLSLLMQLGESEPEEFPKHLIDDSDTPSRWFEILFSSGRKKPSEIYKEYSEIEYQPRTEYERRMLIHVANGELAEDNAFLQQLLSSPDRLNYSEYIQENERLYYTGMLKALLHPMVGGRKKRRTQRRRKTHRK